MAKRTDPLAGWKLQSQPTGPVQEGFSAVKALLVPLAGDALAAQTQKFPPKYVLDVSSRVKLHRGKRFASVAAVGDTIYFELCQWDDAFQKGLAKALKGISKPGYEGYEFTSVPESLRATLAAFVKSAADNLLGQTKKESALKPVKPAADVAVPPAAQWATPVSWAGPKAKPSDNYSRFIPADASFTRGELIFTLSKAVGAGMTEESELTLPALLQLEKRKGAETFRVLAAHAVGPDGQSWSFRLVREGMTEFMPLFVGKTFADQAPAPTALLERYRFSDLTVQSVLTVERGKAIYFRLMENFEIAEEDEADDYDDGE